MLPILTNLRYVSMLPTTPENRVNCNYCNWNLFTIILNPERVIGISIPYNPHPLHNTNRRALQIIVPPYLCRLQFVKNFTLSLPIQNENGTWEAISFIGYFENILQGKNLLTPVLEFMTEEPKQSLNKKKQRNINEEEEIEVDEQSNNDIQEINDNLNDDEDDNDEDETGDERCGNSHRYAASYGQGSGSIARKTRPFD